MKQSYQNTNVTLHRGGEGTEKEGGREGEGKGIYEGQALLL